MAQTAAKIVQQEGRNETTKEEALEAIGNLASSLHKQIKDLDAESREISEKRAVLEVRRDEVHSKRDSLQRTLDHLAAVWKATAEAKSPVPSWMKSEGK